MFFKDLKDVLPPGYSSILLAHFLDHNENLLLNASKGLRYVWVAHEVFLKENLFTNLKAIIVCSCPTFCSICMSCCNVLCYERVSDLCHY